MKCKTQLLLLLGCFLGIVTSIFAGFSIEDWLQYREQKWEETSCSIIANSIGQVGPEQWKPWATVIPDLTNKPGNITKDCHNSFDCARRFVSSDYPVGTKKECWVSQDKISSDPRNTKLYGYTIGLAITWFISIGYLLRSCAQDYKRTVTTHQN